MSFTRLPFPFLRIIGCQVVLLCSLAASVSAQVIVPLLTVDPQDSGIDLGESERQINGLPARPRSFAHEDQPADDILAPEAPREARVSLDGRGRSRSFSVGELYERALRHSKQIQVFSDLPLIRETGIQEAKGAFDTNTFIEGKYDHTNDPVGNVLTTGGADRFKQDELSIEGGAKKKFITGTEVTLSQKVSHIDNNSIYFQPNPQATARLELTVVQPLLKGVGQSYNRSVMSIAKLDSQVAMSEFVRQSESHLLEITRTYWALYAARVTFRQKQGLVEDTGRVAEELRARQQVDARQTQLFRAQSAIASRRGDLVRAGAAVRNAQDRLRALTSDPELLDSPEGEIIPSDPLFLGRPPVDVQQACYTALRNRPEITQAFLQLKAANIRQDVARNELLPELNLVLRGSLGGLSGDEAATAYGREYYTGGPGYGIGFRFTFPLENNIARAHNRRRQLETRQQISQIKTTIDTVLLEVKVSAREVDTAYRETQAKFQAVHAFTEDLNSLTARRLLQDLSDDAKVSSYLDQTLDAQDRRTIADEDFIRSVANYQISLVNLERAKGSLLAYSDINVVRGEDEKRLPKLWLEKGAHDGKSARGVGVK